MSVDNRTDINDCEDDATNFSTTGSPAALGTNTTTGQFYEGAGAVEAQHSDAFDDTTTESDSADVALALDLSDATCYLLIKDSLLENFANLGSMIVIGDGTDRIGYATGGNDAPGFPLIPFFTAFKLDVNFAAANPGTVDVDHHAFAGSEVNLDQTNITDFGIGTFHLAPAVGNIANIFMDTFCFIANDSYALTINGGTVGTPETMTDVQGDDVGGLLTGLGYGGMINNPKGSEFGFFAPTEWGNAANVADVFFTANDEQWFWIGNNQGGHSVGATHFPMRIVGNATDTIDIKWTNVIIVNVGTRAQFIAGDTNVNVMQMDAVSFTDVGTIDFTVQSPGSRFVDNCIFNNCDQITFSSIDADNCTINGSTDPDGAVLWSTTAADVSNQDDFTYISDGTGHGIHINLNTASTTTYNISGYEVSDYDGTGAGPGGGSTGNELFLIDNALDGDVIINVTDGVGTFNDFQKAAGYTGNVTINQTVTLSLTGIQTDSEVSIINLDDTINFDRTLSSAEQISGVVTAVAIANQGTGYAVNDVLTAVGGTGVAATFTVDTIGGGGEVTSVSITTSGSYTANPPTPTTTTVAPAGGTGCTLRLTISGTHDFTYDAGLGVKVAIIVFHLNFKEVRIEQVLPTTNSSIPIQQNIDRVFNNP